MCREDGMEGVGIWLGCVADCALFGFCGCPNGYGDRPENEFEEEDISGRYARIGILVGMKVCFLGQCC